MLRWLYVALHLLFEAQAARRGGGSSDGAVVRVSNHQAT